MNIVSAHRADVSLKTAELCLRRLFPNFSRLLRNIKRKYELRNTWISLSCYEDVGLNETISIDQFREVAFKCGLEIRYVRLDWQMLQDSISVAPILLLLNNKNVVVALRSDAGSTDKIVAFDPLYLSGKDFFLPRRALETAWGGDAIVVKELSLKENSWIRSFTSAFVVCAAMAAVGLILLYPRYAGKERSVFTVMHTEASSKVLPSDSKPPSAIAPTSNIRAEVLLRPSEVQPGYPNLKRAAPAAAPGPASAPNADARTPVAPNSAPVAVIAKPVGMPSPVSAPETNALTVALNSEPAAVVSTPAAAPAPASAPETDTLTPVARNSEPVAVVSAAAAPPAPASAPDADALALTAVPSPDVAQVPVAPKSRQSINSAEILALVAHGDALFRTRDLTSARLFYERAADAGYGQAALRLGESYDPVFLASNRIPDRGDATLAARWYRRAHELGVAVAETLLNVLQR